MARRTFFSFHYQEDVWRVFNVRKCWDIGKDREADGFFDGSVFEASKKEGDDALKAFLREGLKNTSVTCVLAGQYTAARRWVRYEIVRSVLKGNGLLTVDIHGIRNDKQVLGVKGPDPLAEVGVYLSKGKLYFAELKAGKWVQYSDYVSSIPASELWFDAPTRENTVVELSQHCKRYDFVAKNGRDNIADWIEIAAVQAGR
ncbi:MULTISPECIES: TIR domain-containing protein [unclassified Pseudomonas]|uniref:TIR domain-containing protein n=1 Tax=unclassified Pseudomonas TaxID=196821 RepID=UPI001E47B656|nr:MULTISPECIES: TIR domain-containing protein [unclassified Pseudomonas]MDH1692365.1 TIR domain-containing protein [Pseudomonas sp. GD03766]UFH29551.1 TIR domain-containing protein [Pseudomonas sp. CIP-10]